MVGDRAILIALHLSGVLTSFGLSDAAHPSLRHAHLTGRPSEWVSIGSRPRRLMLLGPNHDIHVAIFALHKTALVDLQALAIAPARRVRTESAGDVICKTMLARRVTVDEQYTLEAPLHPLSFASSSSDPQHLRRKLSLVRLVTLHEGGN